MSCIWSLHYSFIHFSIGLLPQRTQQTQTICCGLNLPAFPGIWPPRKVAAEDRRCSLIPIHQRPKNRKRRWQTVSFFYPWKYKCANTQRDNGNRRRNSLLPAGGVRLEDCGLLADPFHKQLLETTVASPLDWQRHGSGT